MKTDYRTNYYEIRGTDKRCYDNGDYGAGDNILWEDRKTRDAALRAARKMFLKNDDCYSVWIEWVDADGDYDEDKQERYYSDDERDLSKLFNLES